MNHHVRRAGTAIAVLALTLAACGGDSGTASGGGGGGGGGGGDGEATSDTLTVGWSTLGNESLYPVMAQADQDMYLDQMFEYLVYAVRDTDTFEVEPGLATEWSANDDDTVWTFTLRDDVTFSNGEELTSADVKYSFEQYVVEDAVTPRAPFLRGAIESVDTPDPTTAVFNLTRPIASFPMEISDLHSNSILPDEYLAEVGPEEFAQAPIGSGPYAFASQELGQSITFEAVEDHWRQTAGYPKLVVRLLEDPSARINALESGEVDIIDLPADLKGQAEDLGADIVEVPNTINEWINLGGLVPEDSPNYDPSVPWNDVKVREAMNLAIDRQAIADVVYSGTAVPSGTLLSTPGTLGLTDDLEIPEAPEQDLDRARELLAEAGFEDGFSFDLYTWSFPPSTQLEPMAEAVAQMWSEVGIDAQITPVTYTGFREKIGTPEVSGAAWTFRVAQFPDLTETIPLFWQSEGSFPIAISDELDEKVADIASIIDPEERAPAMNDLITYTAEEQLGIPVVYSSQLAAKQSDVGTWPILPGLGYKIGFASIEPAA